MGEKTGRKGKKQIQMRDQLGRKTRMKYNTEAGKLQKIEQEPVEMQNRERTDPSHDRELDVKLRIVDRGMRPADRSANSWIGFKQ